MIRTARSLALTFAALAAVVALLAVFRIPLSEAGLKAWLAANGVETPAFRIDRLGLAGLTIVDASAGTDGAVTVVRIAVDWTPATLLRGRVESAAIEGLRVRARIADDSFGIAGIALPEAEPGDEEGGKPFALPLQRLDIADSRLDLETPYGPLVVKATAHYGDAGGGGISGGVSVAAQGEPGHVSFTANATGPDAGRVDGTFDLTDGSIDTPVLRVPAFRGEGSFRVADFRLDIVSFSLAAGELALPAVPGGLTGRLDAEGDYANGEASLRLSFEEAQGGRGARGTITVSRLTGTAEAFSGSMLIDAGLRLYAADGIVLRDVTARLPLTVRRDGPTVAITIAENAQITAAKISGPGMTTREPVSVTLPATGEPLATLTLGEDGGLAAVDHTVSAVVAPTHVGITDGGTPTLGLAETRLTYTGRYDAPGRYTGHGTLANTNASVNAPPLALQRIEADITVTDFDGNGRLRVDIGRLSDKAAPERFTAVGVALTLTRKEGKGRFVATVRDATQTIRATASGPWPLDGPRDEIFIDVPPIAFETAGKQPATLFPILSALDVAQGRVFGNARIGRRGADWRGTADIAIEDMSFSLAGAEVANLSVSTHFDSIVPPTTPPAQSLTIDRIDMVTPIEDVRIEYAIASGDGTPRLDIASARATALGGTIAVAETSVPLDGRPVELPVVVSGLDVTRLLELLGVEDLTGSGALSGRIPLLLSPNAVEIRGGRITADGPGVLRLNAESAADFLTAQGPSVDLAIRALEDFRYSKLTIDIDRKAAGEARLALSLLGHNPAVLDGHPFRFNINLKSNVDELIAALLQGYRIATERVGGAEKQ